MREREAKLLGAACFLGGVVIGFLLSPIKKGMYLGNNCGNSYSGQGETEEIKSDEDLEQLIEENIEK